MMDVLVAIGLFVLLQIGMVGLMLLLRGRKGLRTCCGHPIPDHFPTENGTLPAGFRRPEEK